MPEVEAPKTKLVDLRTLINELKDLGHYHYLESSYCDARGCTGNDPMFMVSDLNYFLEAKCQK